MNLASGSRLGPYEIVAPLEGSGIRPIPGLDSIYYLRGWSPDGKSVYAISSRAKDQKGAKVYQVDTVTGKMELWRTLGAEGAAGIGRVRFPVFASDGSAYAYVYNQTLSEAYVVTELK